MASLIGKEIGKYRITERLGQGGMAEVYAGVHTHLDRKVAVKVLHSYLLEGGDFVDRFKREAKAVANLRHPNIVQVYDFDIQDDLIFMVMEYIDGVNLHAKLVEVGNRGERLPIKLIGSIINDIASALDYAHSKDMLHRDIKPSNIMIDSEDKAYLTDFGIAKLLSDQKFTATGTLVGTPAYMSPEQGLGDDVSKESDIYSLGVVAFEMLTGQVPYDAKTPIGIVHKQINDPVPDMSELVDGVPSSAQEVIDRALAKAPESRFSSAEDLVGALRTALAALESTEPIAVPATETPTVIDDRLESPTVSMDAEEMEQPTVVMKDEQPAKQEKAEEEPKPPKERKSKPEKPLKDKKKIPIWAYIVGGVALLAIAGVVLTQMLDLGGSGSPETTDPNAVEVFVNPGQTDQGLEIMNDISDGNYQVIEVNQETVFGTGNGAPLDADDGNPDGDYYLYFNIDDSLMFGLPEDAEVIVYVRFLDQGSDSFSLEYDAHFGGEMGDGRFRIAGVYNKTNSGEFLTAQFNLSAPHLGNRNNGADIRVTDNGDGEDLIQEVRVVWASPTAMGEEEELYNQAVAYFEEGKFAESIDACNQAIEAGFENSEVYLLIGRSLRNMGAFEEALGPLNTAIELDPGNFWAYFNLGRVQGELGDFAPAIENFQITTELDPNSWSAWYYLGESYYLSGDDGYTDPALEALEKAINLNPERSESYQARGEIKLLRLGDVEGALEDANTAIEYARDGDPAPFVLRASVYQALGEFHICVDDITHALEFDSPDHVGSYLIRGDCFNAIDEIDQAKHDYEMFLELSGDRPEFAEHIERVVSWIEEH